MAGTEDLTPADLRYLEQRGIPAAEAYRQIGLLRRPRRAVVLDRPCTVGDGIRQLSEAEVAAALDAWREGVQTGRLGRFVPASGAATRMFRSLIAARRAVPELPITEIERRAAGGDPDWKEVLTFARALREFAFFPALQECMARDGLDGERLIAEGRYGPIVDYLLDERGLGYAGLPKGLLLFHRYEDGARTAFEEHLVEAAMTARAADGRCRLHFTVSPRHRERFAALLEAVRAGYERRFDARFEVSFSVQDPATDTLALDGSGRPFRLEDGTLCLRPGGHGALLRNLEGTGFDVVTIKNIDNVVPEHRAGTAWRWKGVLAGVLLRIERAVHGALRALEEDGAVEPALEVARDVLGLDLPRQAVSGQSAERAAALRELLDRPLRVCGMVPNTGEPGGGPFWVRERSGRLSRQIVEQAEIDSGDAAQVAIFRSSTHFNPVDMVATLRDHRGRPFRLADYVDHERVFVTDKTEGGRPLRALEWPGLWNGGMARWTSVFVEVPLETFQPVKTIVDLLRPAHR